MTKEQRSLALHRLARGREAIEEARVLLTSGHANAAVNRVYYGCFYAVSALLLTEGLSSSKHSGVRALFDREWVKSGRLGPELGRLYRRFYEARQDSDYADFIFFEAATVAPWLDEGARFVEALGAHIEGSPST